MMVHHHAKVKLLAKFNRKQNDWDNNEVIDLPKNKLLFLEHDLECVSI